jgi:4-diphosphocytidyl-2-C-methyl-D-erythritol kinase
MPVAENSETVRVRVPAKVNLYLGVGGARSDGYHELTTVYQAVSIYDEIIARHFEGIKLRVFGEDVGEVPTDETNLAWRAAAALARSADVSANVALDLHKTIPVAGGMAGGSADAAAALLACATLWRTGTSKAELVAVAARLGSDVVFPLAGGTALGTGRGEQVTPVLATGEYHWVFAMADYGISAGAAYSELDRLRAAGSAPPPNGSPDQVLDALRSGDAGRLADALHNDLEAAAVSLHPELRDVLAAGAEFGALAGIISGSGPTCAFLCAHADAARDLADDLDSAELCRSVELATAPASGARVTG